MKKIIAILMIILSSIYMNAQKKYSPEHYGNTLNIGVGIGYYGYIHNPLPVAVLNYEIDVFRNFTLAPFVSFYSYRNDEFGFNTTTNGYTYKETVAPVGLKGAYYFDELFHANKKWDFYAAASIGFIIRSITWSSSYYGT